MPYIPTQQDLDILHQHKVNLYIIINLLNTDLKTIDNLQGELISDTFTIDAESDIRRTFNLTLFVKDSSFYIDSSSKIWLDKYINIQIGVRDQRTKEVVYYNMGTYLFDEVGYKYDATTKTLTLSCVDLMANFTGLRNGQVMGLSTLIPVEDDQGNPTIIRNAIVTVLEQQANYHNYRVNARLDSDGNPETLSHDLKFTAGATIYDILLELNEQDAGWEMFFDIDNTFVNQKIPTTEADPYVLDWETLNDLIISESIDTKFSEVKNSTRVWGKCLDADRFIETVTNSGAEYRGTLEYLVPEGNDDIPFGTTIAFTPNVNNSSNPTLKITDPKASPVVDSNGNVTYTTFSQAYPIVDAGDNAISAGKLVANTCYVLKYKAEKFYLQGQFQIVYVVKEYNKAPWQQGQESQWKAQDMANENTHNVKYIINPDNPFAIDAIGEIRQVLEGGEYDKIYTDDLARQRAEYENWKAMRLNYELVLRMKPVLWLDVNQKIQYKSKVTGKIEEYIIKSIDGSSMSGEVSVKAIKFYPLYPFVVED